MSVKSLKIVNILIWGGVGLLTVGVILSFPFISPYLSTLQAMPASPSIKVTATPTVKPAAVLLPFGSAPRTGTPLATAADRPPAPTPTWTPPIPEDADPDAVYTYTLPSAPGLVPVGLRIPAINLESPIAPIGQKTIEVRGTEQAIWDVPNWRAAGWHETSALIGVPGNTVLNGHNTSNGEVFRYLYKLNVGALVLVETEEGETRAYTVAEKLILKEAGQPLEVRLENAQYIQPTEDERLTLVTCHPYGSLANRLLIIARPAEMPNAE